MSESPPSEGGARIMRILVGGRALVPKTSGMEEPSREGAAEAANDEAAFDAFPLPEPLTGAEIDDNLGSAMPTSPPFARAAAATAEAYSDSFSPTQERANQRPPAIPRISRLAVRQCLTLLPLLSSGMTGAKPVAILGGIWTGKGFVGRE
jgi:hypothetical protein